MPDSKDIPENLHKNGMQDFLLLLLFFGFCLSLQVKLNVLSGTHFTAVTKPNWNLSSANKQNSSFLGQIYIVQPNLILMLIQTVKASL